MKIVRSLRNLKIKGPTAVTIGVFDGVHAGHQALIKKTVASSKKIKGKSVLVTFDGHPDRLFAGDLGLKLIKNTMHNIDIIKSYGIDIVALLDLKKLAGMEADEFVRGILLEKFNMKHIAAGRDFIFGRGGAGNIGLLKKLGREYGFGVDVVPDVRIKGKKVSSTLIRRMLMKGDIKSVEKMLGRKYSIEGRVIQGRHIGRSLGFPTANIKIEYEEIPARGVWAVEVECGGRFYAGAANIGFAPTLKAEKSALIEVFIFDFDRKIYGKKIKVTFLERLRDEKKFTGPDELIEQINKDITYIRKKYSFIRRKNHAN
jgi:riboflavin kinase/FMN adenylyltransferase